MSWVIRIGSTRFERDRNAAVITSIQCSITATPSQLIAQLRFTPNADRTTLDKAGSNPACPVEQAWQNVLSDLVGA